MTIRRSIDAGEIKPGDYILGNSVLRYGICGRPGQVTRIAGKRIYYTRFLQDGSGKTEDTHMNRDQVLFVCDTEREMIALMQLSAEREHDISVAVANIEQDLSEQYDLRLSILVKEEA